MSLVPSCEEKGRSRPGATLIGAIFLLSFVGCARVQYNLAGFFGAPRPTEIDTETEFAGSFDAEPADVVIEPNESPELAAENPPLPSPSQAERDEVERQLEAIAQIDPAQAEQLREELREIDPQAWPLIMGQAVAWAERNAQPTDIADVANVANVANVAENEPAFESYPPLPAHSLAPLPPSVTIPRETAVASQQPLRSAEEGSPIDLLAFTDLSVPAIAPVSEATTVAYAGGEFVQPLTDSWQESLDDSIEALRRELDASRGDSENESKDRASLEARLRLLYLAADQHRDAIIPSEEWSAEEQQFWTHQLQALHLQMDREGVPADHVRATMTLAELRSAQNHLKNQARLEVRHLAFCTGVSSFGKYIEFDPSEFRSNQEIVLYAEVDNFHVEPASQGYITSLQGSYQIFDITGRRLADHVFPLDVEECGTWRRDFFFAWKMYMPRNIRPGQYTLQLTIEDTQGAKFGQSTIGFTVIE